MTKIFDCERDNKIVASGGFWCRGCLVAHTIDKISMDPRYCQQCCDFLLDEATRLPASRGKPTWVPVSNRPVLCPTDVKPVTKLPHHTKTPVEVTKLADGDNPVDKKHAGGRPIKEGEVSKRTEYRRQKAQQGVLL